MKVPERPIPRNWPPVRVSALWPALGASNDSSRLPLHSLKGGPSTVAQALKSIGCANIARAEVISSDSRSWRVGDEVDFVGCGDAGALHERKQSPHGAGDECCTIRVVGSEARLDSDHAPGLQPRIPKDRPDLVRGCRNPASLEHLSAIHKINRSTTGRRNGPGGEYIELDRQTTRPPGRNTVAWIRRTADGSWVRT